MLTSPLLESLDSPKTSRNFCRLLPITDETCSAASNPGPSAAALGWALETLRREAVTLIRPALLPVPELLLPPGRAGNRHRQLCAILHSLSACDCPCDQRYLGGRNPNPALYINNLYHSAALSLAGMSLCTLRGGNKGTPTIHSLGGSIRALRMAESQPGSGALPGNWGSRLNREGRTKPLLLIIIVRRKSHISAVLYRVNEHAIYSHYEKDYCSAGLATLRTQSNCTQWIIGRCDVEKRMKTSL